MGGQTMARQTANLANITDRQKTASEPPVLLGRQPTLVSARPQASPSKTFEHPSSVTTASRETDLELIQNLQNRIRKVETAQRIDQGDTVSAGCNAINRLLPGGGYPKGALVQWLSDGGYGADYLSLLAAKEACHDGGALVVVDPLHQFYPPAAAAIGINMGNLIVLRADQKKRSSSHPDSSSVVENDLLWSIDQALRCPAVAAVWGALDFIDERWFRRFQLSAESSGCLGLFLQPLSQAKQPSWAEVQWLIGNTRSVSQKPLPPSSRRTGVHRVRLQLTRCRGTQTGKSVKVDIDSISGEVKGAVASLQVRKPPRPLPLNANA